MLKYFELEDYEVLVFRIWFVMLIVFLPVYGWFLLEFSEGAVDFMSHRLLLSAYWLFFFFSSFFNKTIRKYLALPCYIGNFIVISWILWIVNLNHFSPDYSMGLFLCFSGIAIINRSNIEMISFYVFSFSILFYCFYYYPDTEISKIIFTLSVFILFLVHVVVMGKKDFIDRNLRQLNQKLKFKHKRLKQLMYVSSHDLKTPVRNIGSFSSLIESNIEEGQFDLEETKTYIGYILKGALKMDHKLDDLLEFFRFDNSEIEIQEILILDLFQNIKSILSKKRKDIEIIWTNNFPNKINGSKQQIQQLFYHLIDNGIKYNHSKTKKIELSYSSNHSHHIFMIKDNGIGIDLKYKNKIFDLFQRLHNDDSISGTGAGLAICKSIVENHEGEIQLSKGKEGEGTEFTFTIKKRL